MDKHTFIGKRKVGSTDICDFTDYQGIGHDPLYKRYESVNSIVKRVISPEYAHFLSAPLYSADEDLVNWYIDEWEETPEAFVKLSGEKRERYNRIKEATIAHYRNALDSLSGEELQVMACALRYMDDNFIFCADGKVYLLAWGMTPDTRKHISLGELVHAAPGVTKYNITFDAGKHGDILSPLQKEISLQEGTQITSNDLPIVDVHDGFTLRGWTPEPIGTTVESDMTFTAQYDRIVVPIPEPPVPPAPKLITCRFTAPEGTAINGPTVLTKPLGSSLLPAEIPPVVPPKGFIFKGWNINPLNMALTRDVEFKAVLEKKSGFPAWLKWLLLALLILLLLGLAGWLLSNCSGCHRPVNGVVPLPSVVLPDGDTIDDNGRVRPIELDDGRLPEENAIVAPVRDENGEAAPIVRDPGVPPVFGNRLILFLENENDNVDALAADFKKAYPGSQYSIIGFDRDVKSLVIQIPENERDNIRKTINSKIPNHKFIVFDEEVYELNGAMSNSPEKDPGWHLKAVKAEEGWKITRGSPDIKVAVVDDGIQASHPIFKDRIVDAYNVFTQNNHLSNGEGHGTHTAGLAVGSLDYMNKGAAGIAPDCRLIPIQVIDNGECPLSALVSGIMYAIHKGADVVN
ncbi:MAG: S8 family serine peptidase, partial [Muribaculaceae bacterium]|nr:S8 family serine peptidase [Muribaculaceae bacterium]